MSDNVVKLEPVSVPADVSAQALQAAIGANDLSQLSPEQKMKYLSAICNSTGLNPLTQPFAIMKIDGRDVLYAKAECAAQLRKLHKVTITIGGRMTSNGCYIVQVKAKLPDGTEDESVGVVPVVESAQTKEWVPGQNRPILKPNPRAGQELSGLEYANAIMKAETKAKRRVTLSICGLGFIDESELEDMRPLQAEVVDDTKLLGNAPERLATIVDGASEPAKPAEKPKPEPKPAKQAAPEKDLFGQQEPKPTPPKAEPPPPKPEPTAPTPEPEKSSKEAPFKNPDGTLSDSTVDRLEKRIGERDDPMGEAATQPSQTVLRYLIAKGKLKQGDPLTKLDATAANYILSKPAEALFKLVEEWAKTQSK